MVTEANVFHPIVWEKGGVPTEKGVYFMQSVAANRKLQLGGTYPDFVVVGAMR